MATWEERQRIARELHDTLEQDLMGVTLLLDSTAERLHANPASATEQLAIARQLLRRSREESRSTIRDLRSVALEQLGLPATLDETLRPIAAAAGLGFALEVSGEPRRLAATAENHLLRIAHEGVSNAVKHAHATHVAIRLAYERESIALEIHDDGQGGADGGARGNGFGLQGVRERVNKLAGTLRFESPAGAGTRLHITAPAPGSVPPFS